MTATHQSARLSLYKSCFKVPMLWTQSSEIIKSEWFVLGLALFYTQFADNNICTGITYVRLDHI